MKIYLYNTEGFYIREVETDLVAMYPNSTQEAPDMEKVESPNWEVRFSPQSKQWVYTSLVTEEQSKSEVEELEEKLLQMKAREQLQKEQENYHKALALQLLPYILDVLVEDIELLTKLKKALDANQSV